MSETATAGRRTFSAYQWGMHLRNRNWRRYGVEEFRDHEGWHVVDRGIARPGAIRRAVRVGEALPSKSAAFARARELNGIAP